MNKELSNEMNKRSQVEKMICDIFDGMEENSFSTLGKMDSPMWEAPVIGVAAGDDPYYAFLKEHIGEFHMSPAEAFALKYRNAPEAEGLRVISMAFPQTAETKDMQRQAKVFPCDNWLVSRGEWEPLIRAFCRKLEKAFEERGIRSVCPDLLDEMSWMYSDKVGHASTWSQRHTAYAAGLGTFGLSDGLITLKGIAVRFTSVIVETELPVNGRVSMDPYGWCTRCGACVSRCPVDAVSLEKGHDKNTCSAYEDYCIENLWPEHIERRDYIFGCGLCQAGIPCTDHPPKKGEVHYRWIKQTDKAQLAQLVRSGLKENGLDIPGTAYFDPHLDRLYEYYTAEPAKRNYFVAVNDKGRVVGGSGVDDFANLDGCAELQKLYVASDYRGQGIASHLVDMVEDEARRLGYDKIYIETHSKLQAARQLYLNKGYSLIDRPEFAVHETMDTFLIKELALT